MNVLIAGASGYLGYEILKKFKSTYNTLAVDLIDNNKENLQYNFKKVDLTNRQNVEGICKDIDIVITTVGLTKASKQFTHYDIDLEGNKNLLKDAIHNNVKKFIYVSVIKCDTDPSIPMLHAKYMFEEELKKSGMDYLIIRPSGYFYDITKVFKPMVDKGIIRLPKNGAKKCNVIHTSDLAKFILENIHRSHETLVVGGTEVYTYDEIAKMFFEFSGKEESYKRVSLKFFDILAFISKISKNGKYANIKFAKWTLNNSMEAEIKYGEKSFREYVKQQFINEI